LRGFAKITRDITERKNVEAALHEAKAQADTANHAKSEFLSRMSHELRTPLNAILGFGQILEMQELTPSQSESIGHILKGGRHLLGLINEVLNIARIEAGQMELSLEPVAIHEIIGEALSLIRPLAAQNSIQLDGKEGLAWDGYVRADRQRLKQVLINLLSNAVKYNREGGRVTITCQEAPEERLRIHISDTGHGIAEEGLKKLFVPFERLHAEQSGIEGTGLGLALSRRLVEVMDGTLSVESVKGKGSTFTIELPLAECPLEQIEPPLDRQPEVAQSAVAAGDFTVLSIEDNVSNFRLIEAILSHRPQIKLIGAIQGSMGLDLAHQHHPDLILLDLHLPDIMGHEVLRRLRDSVETHDIPVIVVSADATVPQINRLLDAGADAYLTKPLNVKEVLSVIDKALQKRDDDNARKLS
jgi:CheY-like chemotaxis protein